MWDTEDNGNQKSSYFVWKSNIKTYIATVVFTEKGLLGKDWNWQAKSPTQKVRKRAKGNNS